MKIKKSLRLVAALVATGLALTNVSRADSLLINSPGNNAWSDSPESIGFEFTLSSAVVLNSLGFFDMANVPLGAGSGGIGNDGLISSHYVGLWSFDGTTATLLADGTVAAGGAGLDDANGFLYTTGLTFHNGFSGTIASGTYLLGATVTGSNTDTADHMTLGSVGLASGATLVGAGFSGPPDTAPQFGISGPYANSAFIGPNLTFSSVPEPSTYVLFLGGATLLLALRRRRA